MSEGDYTSEIHKIVKRNDTVFLSIKIVREHYMLEILPRVVRDGGLQIRKHTRRGELTTDSKNGVNILLLILSLLLYSRGSTKVS